MESNGFTAEQTAAATTALRAAIGLPPERFGTERFISMISDEIEQLRAAGRSNEDIARELGAAGVALRAEDLERWYVAPEERGR